MGRSRLPGRLAKGRRAGKHEKIFLEDYLARYDLEDDIERTLGLWSSPEPSFNAFLKGEPGEVEALAQDWGRAYDQEAMALLIPNPNGEGGKLAWDFGRKLSDEELDGLLSGIIQVNQEMRLAGMDMQVGLTVRKNGNVEYWYSDSQSMDVGEFAIKRAIGLSGLQLKQAANTGGFDMKLLFKGLDY